MEEERTTEAGPKVILKKLQENRDSLHIARVPPTIKKRFQEMADAEFCGDYGMLLKWLVDGIANVEIKLIMDKLSEHEYRIETLEKLKESATTEKPIKKIKLLNGKEIKKNVK